MKKELVKLQDFFVSNGFSVYPFEQDNQQCAELEIWTNGGVDMIITLMPFCKKEFIDWVNNFDIGDEIDIYRQAKDYKAAFTITESVKDFTAFENHLKKVVKKLSLRKNLTL